MASVHPVAKKIGIKPAMRVLLMNAPSSELADALSQSGAAVAARRSGSFDAVLVFARQRRELEAAAPAAIAAVKPDGLLWFCYPKSGSGVESDLKRDIVWEAVAPTGWRPVSQIAIDAVWSALRFRPVEDVKSTRQRPARPAKKSASRSR